MRFRSSLCVVAWFLSTGEVQAHALDEAIASAAVEHQVPEALLQAIGWEATRWKADARTPWGGWGPMDLLEGTTDPSLEHASRLLDRSPDDLIADPFLNIQGAAAILAWHARQIHEGELPVGEDLSVWFDAVRAFSKSDNPLRQSLYAETIFDALSWGPCAETAWGLMCVDEAPTDVSHLVPVPPPSPVDYSGAYQFVAADSSNYSDYSRGPSDIDYVVIHTIQGSYSSAIYWFQDSAANVSSHYVVRSSDGQITQMVWEEDVAWHAGNWDYNLASVGIEHEGYVDEPEVYYTDAMYEASAALTADICERNGIPVDRDHIIGHNEVPGATHTDPGDGWDWDTYMDWIGEGSGGATGTLLGIVADTDIYNGERIEGATVWLPSTGESATSDAEGNWSFSDLAMGTYTVKARANGYQTGSCTKEITGTGDFWCSIALEVGEGADTAHDTGDGPVAGVDGDDDLERKACGCAHGRASGGVGFGLMVLLLGGSFWRRSVS